MMATKMISKKSARDICMQAFAGTMGAADNVAAAASDALVDANLRGKDSHGIRLLPQYLSRWKSGRIVADAALDIEKETETTAVINAQEGIGQYVSTKAMGLACQKARKLGIGSAVTYHSNHNGAISHYTIQAARQGLIGIAGTACALHVAPFGGASGLHGTNPLSYALPRGENDPVVFDFSTAHSAAKMKKASVVPEGRLLDKQGNPSTNIKDLGDGWILPVAGHVGFGLGLLVDSLTAALANSLIGTQLPRGDDLSRPNDASFFALAISPDAFGGSKGYFERINELVRQIESTRPLDPEVPVRWPGQRGWQLRRQRLAEGIPMDEPVWDAFLAQLAAWDIRPAG